MKSLAIVTVVGLCALATDATAQSWQPPLPNERCPSKWGATDERGSGNHMTPANVLRAAQLIKTGETFELGHVLGRDMPLNPGRQYDVHTKRSTGPFGSNQRYSNEELVVSEIGQVGTQFDGFTHQAIDRLLYNCVKMDEIATRSGFAKMGMEKVGTLMTRGVLIDIAGLKGVEILPINYEITVADLEQALQKQGIRLQAGHRRGCSPVADQAGPDAAWRRQLAGRGRPQSGQGGQSPGPQHRTYCQRCPSAREPRARRPGQGTRLRVRVRHAAAEATGGDRFDRGTDCDPLRATWDREGARPHRRAHSPLPTRWSNKLVRRGDATLPRSHRDYTERL